jgi:hypothetical protein
MEWTALIGSALGLGFLAGIRLYATVFFLGLAIQFGWIPLGTGQEHWAVLAHPAVLVVSGVAFLVEFIADKIPFVDSAWDTFHTFIRPVGAALLATTVVGESDPVLTTILMILSGGVALASHSSKAASRLAINHSPEPFSNVLASLFEDGLTVFGIWLAVNHPIITLIVVVLFLAVFAWLASKIFRAIRTQMSTFYSRHRLRHQG